MKYFSDTVYNATEPWQHYAKEKKPDIKDCVL